MTFPTSTPERLMWAVLIILAAGYMLGSFLNRRRSKAVRRWLQAGVRRLGGKAAWTLGRGVTYGAQAVVKEADAPFEQVKIVYGLLTRELPALWAIELLRGRRDTLAVHADLRGEPAGEIEVLPLAGSLRRKLDQAAGDQAAGGQAAGGQPWQWREGPAGLGLATRGPVDKRLAAGVGKFLERYGADVQRLSVRKRHPHVMLFLKLGRIERSAAAGLLDAVRELGRAVRGPGVAVGD